MTSEELSRRIEDERAAIHAEYEQERIAYQKLLKDYNRQEAQLENLQDQMMGSHENRSVSNMSFLDSELDLESAYGSTSARSSFRYLLFAVVALKAPDWLFAECRTHKRELFLRNMKKVVTVKRLQQLLLNIP